MMVIKCLLLTALVLAASTTVHATQLARVLVLDEQLPKQKMGYGDRFFVKTNVPNLEKQRGFVGKTRKVDDEGQALSDAALDAYDNMLTGIVGSHAHAVEFQDKVFIPTRFAVWMRSPDGEFLTLDQPTASPEVAGVKEPWSDRDDSILVAADANHRHRKFIVADRKSVALAGNRSICDEGVAGPTSNAAISEPHSIITHPRTSDTYIADFRNHRVLQSKVEQASHVASPANSPAHMPIWDLATSEIPADLRSGSFAKADGEIALKDGSAFAVPAEAFPDQRNFTVQVALSLDALVQDAVFTVMRKQSEQDDGFSLFFNYRDSPDYSRQINSVVNNILMVGGGINGRQGPQVQTPYEFTLAVRDGLATFYIDDAPIKTCFMELTPNHEPMWIGRNADPKTKTMPVTIRNIKVFGPTYQYVSTRERKSEFPRGAVAGKGWALDVPRIDHPEWPKVLIYGDSISSGYGNYFIPEMLKQNIYVFHCVHFVIGEVPEAALTEMAGRYKFDAIVFNNGLHSLGWTSDKVPDAVVLNRMRKLTRCFKAGAPQAKIFYLMTTPHTAARPAPGKPVADLGAKNDVVLRLNTLSTRVMKEEKIEMIDAYSLLSARLDLAAGDNFHWQAPAYDLLSRQIVQQILPALRKKD